MYMTFAVYAVLHCTMTGQTDQSSGVIHFRATAKARGCRMTTINVLRAIRNTGIHRTEAAS